MSDVKYPHIIVELEGHDSNAYAILGSVRRAMRKAKVSQEEIDKFTEEAMSGDYDNLLTTCMKWVNVE